VSPEAASDRLAIRELIDAYAHCADRRDAKGQMALFTREPHFVVYYTESGSDTPDLELHNRADLAPVFDDLNRYRATMHFNGQSTVKLDGDTATGETYCLAHHVSVDGDSQTIFIAAIRYYDTFAKSDGAWLFAERKLYVDWTDTRPLGSPAA
jgi:SnoaL-like domain